MVFFKLNWEESCMYCGEVEWELFGFGYYFGLFNNFFFVKKENFKYIIFLNFEWYGVFLYYYDMIEIFFFFLCWF